MHNCVKRQRIKAKKSRKNAHHEFNWSEEIKRHQQKKLPLIAFIDSEKNLDLYKCQSIKLMIDHYWNNQSCDYFKTQFLIYLFFFIFPFAVDIYYVILVTIPYRDLSSAQVIFSVLALVCQLAFFCSEVMQMRSEGKSLRSYFADFWNCNDFFCFPTYFLTLLITWTLVKNGPDATLTHRVTVQLFYCICILQAFVKLLFLCRIFDSVSFFILLIPKIVRDLYSFFVFTTLANALFAAMYMVLDVELSDEYTLVFAPLKWMIFTLRNGLHDFQVDKEDGFLQHFSN